MRYLALGEVLRLHADLVATSGGATGVRDLGRVQAALAQVMATFEGEELYPGIVDKAAALGFGLVQGHAFIDGNKRIGHAAMEVFLMLNGFEVIESVDEQSRLPAACSVPASSRTHGAAVHLHHQGAGTYKDFRQEERRGGTHDAEV